MRGSMAAAVVHAVRRRNRRRRSFIAVPLRLCYDRSRMKTGLDTAHQRDGNSVHDFRVFDAATLPEQPFPNDLPVDTLSKAPAWPIHFCNGVKHCFFAESASCKRNDSHNRVTAISVAVLRLFNPNSSFRLRRTNVVQSSHAEKFLAGLEPYDKMHIGAFGHHGQPVSPN